MKTPFVIFDRDGTLIEHVHYLIDPNLVKFKEDIIPSLTITAQAERAFSMWPNKGEIDMRLSLIHI